MTNIACLCLNSTGLLMCLCACNGPTSGGSTAQNDLIGGFAVENLTEEEIVLMELTFDGQPALPGGVLGPGAKKTIIGRITSVRGSANLHYTDGMIGDRSARVKLEQVDYAGGLDRVVLRLTRNEKWVLIGERDDEEVFHASETIRTDEPAADRQ